MEGIICSVAKNKYGVDIDALIQKVSGSVEIERKYDKYYGFPETLKKTRDCIQNIADNRPVIVIVDELDRCLPMYAIQVLERLHHIFDGLNNVVVIIAMDKSQMSESLKTIYGTNLNVNMYLRKFISFTLQLDNGRATAFLEKYKGYTDLFEWKSEDKELIEEFLTDITYEIDIRTQEKIFEKAETMHRILWNEQKIDASVLLFELLVLCAGEKSKISSIEWLWDSSHNYNMEDVGGDFYYGRIMKYRNDYLDGNQRVGHNGKTYTVIWNAIIQRCFIYFISLHEKYNMGYCGDYFIQGDLQKEVDFVRNIYKLLTA